MDEEQWPTSEATREYPGDFGRAENLDRWSGAVSAALVSGSLRFEARTHDVVWGGACPRCGHHPHASSRMSVTVSGAQGPGSMDALIADEAPPEAAQDPDVTLHLELVCNCVEGHLPAGATEGKDKVRGCGWGRNLDIGPAVQVHLEKRP